VELGSCHTSVVWDLEMVLDFWKNYAALPLASAAVSLLQPCHFRVMSHIRFTAGGAYRRKLLAADWFRKSRRKWISILTVHICCPVCESNLVPGIRT
jgi:hypothetical protein